ncbi:MAG: DUF502 domain-containing protein [Nitrospirae bacterium]|nr:DUF502 domain-containing protein [Nitrospirota bacterium]
MGQNKRSIRGILLTGLAITAPVYLTFLIVRSVFNVLASPFSPLVILFFKNLHINIPESPWIIDLIAAILTICLFYIIGLIGNYVITKKLFLKLENLFFSIPLVKPVYGTMKKMVSLFTDSSEQLYQKVVVVRFPDEKTRMIGFITGESILDNEKYVSVFVPTSPNPTSGFLLFIKNSDIVELPIGVDKAMKLIISAGMMDAVKQTGGGSLAERP